MNDILLKVFAQTPAGKTLLAGDLLAVRQQTNRQQAFFKYSPGFLENGFALDPVNLPLAGKTFATTPGVGMLRAFADCLPDSWGLRLLAAKGGKSLAELTAAGLLEILNGSGLGAISFNGPHQDQSIEFDLIKTVLGEVRRFEKSSLKEAEARNLRYLLACGSSAGGAQPKMIVSMAGGKWIAKPCSIKENPQLTTLLEDAGLTLAKKALIPTAHHKRIVTADRQILLVKRFDITRQGRNAMLSFRALLNRDDPTEVSYNALAEILRRFSVVAGQDIENLFSQMIVNVALNNADGHLQNFSMLRTKTGWRLSPAYDIVPNIYQTFHLLKVNGRHEQIGFEDVIQEGRKMGLSAHLCRSIFGDVIDRIADWETVFDQCEVPQKQTIELRACIDKNLARFSRGLAAITKVQAVPRRVRKARI
ncbi:MAG: type II toxin-antitoxin system HipA family toxin [Deltaproteobacteria bacterium]|nr:type II toxin-antitoxin system HipA family toxin [Deltaproteobacteria bacterium]